MNSRFSKSIIMLLIVSLTLLSTAFAISVTTAEQLEEVLGQTEVGIIELGADIEIESINISVSYGSRYINLNGHTLTLSDSSYIEFDGDGCSLEFYDSSDLGKIVFNNSAIFYVSYLSDAADCSIVLDGGSYIINFGNSIFVSRYSSQDELMNIIVKNATFYKISSSPFSTDNANYDFQNMNVLPLFDNHNYIGFANIYRYIDDILPSSTFIFQNGELYEVNRETTYLRDAYIESRYGNSNMIVSEQTELIDGMITAPQFDAVHEDYTEISYKPLNVTINDEESFVNLGNLKIVLMGHFKNCFDVQNPDGGYIEGEGNWNLGGIRPKQGLPSGQYNVPAKLVYDKDDNGTYETIIGTTAVFFEVLSPKVKLINYWGTSGPYQNRVVVDGKAVSSVESENEIYLVPGEEVDIIIENTEHYENFSIFLRYNNEAKDFFDMELGQDGFMHGSFIVPNYDFAIGVQSRLLELKVTYYSNNNQNITETYFYSVDDDDGVIIVIDDNSFGFTKEDAFFTSWSINSSGSDANQYTRAQIVHFDEAESISLYANWQYMEDIPNINLFGDVVTWDEYDENFLNVLHGYDYEYCVEYDTDIKTFDSDTTSVDLKDICRELGKTSGIYEFSIYARVINDYRISNVYHVEYQYEADHVLGDLNNDGVIGIIDVRLLLQAYINSSSSTIWTQEQLDTMDMDGDETVNIIDVRLLLQKYINS